MTSTGSINGATILAVLREGTSLVGPPQRAIECRHEAMGRALGGKVAPGARTKCGKR